VTSGPWELLNRFDIIAEDQFIDPAWQADLGEKYVCICHPDILSLHESLR
jgi:hypothetical protein